MFVVPNMKLWCQRRLIVVTTSASGEMREVLVERPFARIGKHAKAEIVLSGADIPLLAAYLHVTDTGICYRLLDPKLDPQDDHHFHAVEEGKEFRIGSCTLQVRLAPDDPVEPSAVNPEPVNPPTPVLKITTANVLVDSEPPISRRIHFPLQLIGSDPQCEIELKSETVELCHCVLFWHQSHLWCIDLLSRSGVLLNGRTALCRELTLGDALEIGDYEVKFERFSTRKLHVDASGSTSSSHGAAAESTETKFTVAKLAEKKNTRDKKAISVQKPSAKKVVAAPAKQPLATLSSTTSNTYVQSEMAVASFDAIDIQYGLPMQPMVQLDSMPFAEHMAEEVKRVTDDFATMRSEWSTQLAEVRTLREQLQQELHTVVQQRHEQEQAEAQRIAEREQQRQEWEARQAALSAEEQLVQGLQQDLTTRLERIAQQEAEFSQRSSAATVEMDTLTQQLQIELAAAQRERTHLQANTATVEEQAVRLREQLATLSDQATAAQRQSHEQQQILTQLQERITAQLAESASQQAAQREHYQQLLTEASHWHGQRQADWSASLAELAAAKSVQQEAWHALTATQTQEWEAWKTSLTQLAAQLREREEQSNQAVSLSANVRAEQSRELTRLREEISSFVAKREQVFQELADTGKQFREEFADLTKTVKKQFKDSAKIEEHARHELERIQTEAASIGALRLDLQETFSEERQKLAATQEELATQLAAGTAMQAQIAAELAALQTVHSDVEARVRGIAKEFLKLRESVQEQLAAGAKSAASASQIEKSDARFGYMQQQLENQHESMQAFIEQVSQQLQEFSHERKHLKLNWMALANGLASLGQQLRGDTTEISASSMPVVSVESVELVRLQRELAALKDQIASQQKNSEEVQATLASEMELFAKERAATKHQWGQLSKANSNLVGQYREQVKQLAMERRTLLAEHEKVLAELEKFTSKTNQIAEIHEQLTQLKATLGEAPASE
jgi:chromosome segregation ATPase